MDPAAWVPPLRPPITDIGVWHSDKNPNLPPRWIPLKTSVSGQYQADCNARSYKRKGLMKKTRRIFIIVKREVGKIPITDVGIAFRNADRTGKSPDEIPAGYEVVDKEIWGKEGSGDLNKSTLGRVIFLVYSKTRGAAPIDDIRLIFDDLHEPLPNGYLRVDRTISGRFEADLNADCEYTGGHGRNIFLCYKYVGQNTIPAQLHRFGRRYFHILQWVKMKGHDERSDPDWQQRLLAVKGEYFVMFDGPFNQKISNSKESLPEEYFHDYSFIQSQRFLMTLQRADVHSSLEGQVEVSGRNGAPFPRFSLRFIDGGEKEFLAHVRAIHNNTLAPVEVEEVEEISQQNEEPNIPITDLCIVCDHCKPPAGWTVVNKSVGGVYSGLISGRRKREETGFASSKLAYRRDPDQPPITDIQVIFNDADKDGRTQEDTPHNYKKLRSCMCKTLGSSLNANRGNKKEHRETHIVVTRKLFGDQQVVLGVGVTQVSGEGEAIPEGWVVIDKTTSGTWTANLIEGGREKEDIRLCVKKGQLVLEDTAPVEVDNDLIGVPAPEEAGFRKYLALVKKYYNSNPKATAYGTALGSFVILAVAAAGVTFIPIVVAVLYFAYQKGVTQAEKGRVALLGNSEEESAKMLSNSYDAGAGSDEFAKELLEWEDDNDDDDDDGDGSAGDSDENDEYDKNSKSGKGEPSGTGVNSGRLRDRIMFKLSHVETAAPEPVEDMVTPSHTGGEQTCEWLNQVVKTFWLVSAKGLVKQFLPMIREMTTNIVRSMQDMPLLKGVRIVVKDIDVGNKAPPVFHFMSSEPQSAKHEIVLRTRMSWSSRMEITVGVEKGIHLPVRISNLKMIASAKVVIRLDPDSDLFKTTIGLCLVESCSPRMEITTLAPVTKIPGVEQIVTLVTRAVVNMILMWPQHMAFRLDGSMVDVWKDEETGPIAEISIIHTVEECDKLPSHWKLLHNLYMSDQYADIQQGGDPTFICYRRATKEEIAGGDYLVDIKVGTPDNVPKNYTIIQTTPSGKMACLDRKQKPQFFVVQKKVQGGSGQAITELAVYCQRLSMPEVREELRLWRSGEIPIHSEMSMYFRSRPSSHPEPNEAEMNSPL